MNKISQKTANIILFILTLIFGGLYYIYRTRITFGFLLLFGVWLSVDLVINLVKTKVIKQPQIISGENEK